FSDRGLGCAVLMGPVVPFLSDSPAQLAATVRQIAQAGASSVSPIVLHLRPGAREWFFAWLGEHHPGLVARYRGLYGRGAYAPRAYQQRVSGQVRALARQYRVGQGRPIRAGSSSTGSSSTGSSSTGSSSTGGSSTGGSSTVRPSPAGSGATATQLTLI